ncbi:uncharacterized protein LOC110847774 [Folsomia candida]|uniref:Secreted protein n=1 Tax=Folsomia candida TaxID=158441 RepID=A0A226EIY8_FOLCA|nr:uncharacterized protein LOC110847774 [Folsomia candida]OXA57655.1 hypothetical protein Fcan01_06603 [Folsomia candida]
MTQLILISVLLVVMTTRTDAQHLPLPDKSYCENTELTTHQTSLEFRWKFAQFHNYYDTVRKFYDNVIFKTNLVLNRGENVTCHVVLNVSPQTLTVTLDFAQPNRFATDGALFEGKLRIESRHGNVSFGSEGLRKPNPELKFRWHFDYDDRTTLGRHLDIYTKVAEFANATETTILNNGQPQNIRFVLRIIRYAVEREFFSFGGGEKICV